MIKLKNLTIKNLNEIKDTSIDFSDFFAITINTYNCLEQNIILNILSYLITGKVEPRERNYIVHNLYHSNAKISLSYTMDNRDYVICFDGAKRNPNYDSKRILYLVKDNKYEELKLLKLHDLLGLQLKNIDSSLFVYNSCNIHYNFNTLKPLILNYAENKLILSEAIDIYNSLIKLYKNEINIILSYPILSYAIKKDVILFDDHNFNFLSANVQYFLNLALFLSYKKHVDIHKYPIIIKNLYFKPHEGKAEANYLKQFAKKEKFQFIYTNVQQDEIFYL